jgi:hypothetical protein
VPALTAHDLPVVSIGRPQVWRLTDLLQPDQISPALQAQLADADFYLVQLACSFRRQRDDVVIEWARFSAQLLPDQRSRQPIAFDLHPVQVSHKVQRNVKVTLSPTLKFQKVEASLGKAELGFEYQELEPLISGSGAGEHIPSWDYEPSHGIRLQGSKWMHVLVKAPLGMPTGRAMLDLTADVAAGGLRLPVVAIRNRRKSAQQLRATLWPIR